MQGLILKNNAFPTPQPTAHTPQPTDLSVGCGVWAVGCGVWGLKRILNIRIVDEGRVRERM